MLAALHGFRQLDLQREERARVFGRQAERAGTLGDRVEHDLFARRVFDRQTGLRFGRSDERHEGEPAREQVRDVIERPQLLTFAEPALLRGCHDVCVLRNFFK